jgi:hypothetical protein
MICKGAGMIQIIGTIGIAAIAAILAMIVIAAVRDRRAREASARFAHDLTAKDVERNISADILSKDRPYQPGIFGNDEGGRHYIAGMDGGVRRVQIVPTEDGGETVMMHRKLGKAERKKRKKAIREARELAAHRVQTSALLEVPGSQERGTLTPSGFIPQTAADSATAS